MISRAIGAWDRFWFEPSPAATLGTCRLLFFTGLALWQVPHDYSAWGSYSRVLWMPIWLFDEFNIPLLSSAAIAVLQAVWKVAIVLSAVGLFTRAAMAVTFVLGVYLMGLPHNFGQIQHFDTLIVFVTGALAISRAADACSIDALLAAARQRTPRPPDPSGEYTWPIKFVWVCMALIFCAAGISKLRRSGLEWIFSDNMAYLLRRQQYHLSDGEPWTSWGLIVASYPWMSQGMALAAVAAETLFPLTLFSRTARFVLVPLGLSFLIGIRALMGPTFEQFMMCYVFWIPWHDVAAAVRHRLARPAARLVLYDGGCGLCSRTVAVLARLDVLHRLRFAAVDAEWETIRAAHPSLDRDACLAEMHAVSRSGRVFTGFDAYRSMARVLPLGWVFLPVLFVPGVPWLGRRAYRHVASRRATTSCALPLAPHANL